MATKTKKVTIRKAKVNQEVSMNISLFDVTGKEVKQISLSEKLFNATVNKQVLAQYMRVYLANQRQGNASTKDRKEIVGSTKKIYKQKGTGNARHSSRKAPIFVGGGVQGGPKPKDFSLNINKKQKKQALLASLTLKAQEGSVAAMVNDVLDMKIKTKEFASFMGTVGYTDSKTLIVLPEMKKNNLVLSTRNIPNVTLIQAANINPYILLNSRKIIFIEDSLSKLEDHFLNNNAS